MDWDDLSVDREEPRKLFMARPVPADVDHGSNRRSPMGADDQIVGCDQQCL